MTPTEWIAARRALLAKAKAGAVVVGGGRSADEDLIVAAVNEQEAVLRLVEAADRARACMGFVGRGEPSYDEAYHALGAALAALVGGEE